MTRPPLGAFDRRSLLKLMGGGCALAASGCTIAEVFGVTAGGQVAFDLAEPDFAPLRQVGGAVALDTGGRAVILIRVSETRVVALNRICTHEACDMKPGTLGRWDGAKLICLCHNSHFNAEGVVLQGPANRDLTSYPVTFDAATGKGTITFGNADPAGAGGVGGDDDDDGDVDEDADEDADEAAEEGRAGAGGGGAGGGGAGGGGGVEVPAAYRDLTNPFAGNATALAAGQARYADACSGCHGANGEGNAAFPMPQPSAFTVDQSGWTDGYLFWRLKEGAAGGPPGTIMSAYGETYTDDELWELVTYIRSLGL